MINQPNQRNRFIPPQLATPKPIFAKARNRENQFSALALPRFRDFYTNLTSGFSPHLTTRRPPTPD